MEATPQQLKVLPPPLLAWYDENRRVLPWREQVSPYRCLLYTSDAADE